MLPSPCPTLEVLVEAAAGPLPPELSAHVVGCSICQRRLQELQGELALLADARQAVTESLDPRVRAALMDTCERVLEEDRTRSRSRATGGCGGVHHNPGPCSDTRPST